MGLDIVEIVLRTEETFAIDLPDSRCAQIQTVGDLYRAALEELRVAVVEIKLVESDRAGMERGRWLALARTPRVTPVNWNASEVWWALRAIIEDQLGVPPEDVFEDAHFQRDLGAD